jgi:SPP1 family predicted phage head-tail adaptor
MGINFGSYDQSITFVNFQNISDGYGGSVPTAVNVLTTFASINQVRGGMDIESAQMTLPRTFNAKIQWRSTFVPNETMQVRYRGVNHKITGVTLQDERMTKEYWFTMVRVSEALILGTEDNTANEYIETDYIENYFE